MGVVFLIIRSFVWNVALAIVALTSLLVPQPWPLTAGK